MASDELREKIAKAVRLGNWQHASPEGIADAILALLPKPTDDVKALIEEARKSANTMRIAIGVGAWPRVTLHRTRAEQVLDTIARLASHVEALEAAQRSLTETRQMHVYAPAMGTPVCMICGHMSSDACHFAQQQETRSNDE